MTPGTCINFTGIQNTESCCKAGVKYYDAFGLGKAGIFLRMPCIQYRTLPAHGKGTYIEPGEDTVRKEIDRRGESMLPCEMFRDPTQEEVEQDRVEADAHLQRTFAAIRVASTWRVKPKPAIDRNETIECPICKGVLHLSQSAYNGHVHGKCETAGCVSWME